MCTPLDLFSAPEPHFIPGYTGYCPQYKFRSGNTYGVCTHKVLVDPTVNHSENLILSDRSTDEYQVYRPSQRDIDLVKARTMHGGEIYQHPMVASYEGFVPRMNNHFGQTYSVAATEALSEFERQQISNRRALHYMKIIGAAQDDTWDPMSLQDKALLKTDYKMPLTAVRPEQVGIIRDRTVVEQVIEPPIQSQSPYFMDNNNPNKRIKKGTATCVPFGYSRFGTTNDLMTNSALCDFTSNYRRRLSTEWAPVNLSRPDPPLHFQPMEIYHKHIGQVPNYCGHIPGAIFRCGKTFGEDSRDAKRWLRRDFRI
ncbi:UNVERIFIED_CONTAM: hypothetical protein PYX00_003835 [Menopon gallinae]|uniref:Ciliary microtubule inner protein 2A-C-like domain-containing protein n=1 Tax=Menopon gallinae TaxID=328185 RepID=A0AAW2I2H3_9NEOP